MSSTADSLKQSATEQASDEPNAKKAKLDEQEAGGGGGETDNKNSASVDKNGTKITTATEKIDSKNITNNNNNNNNNNTKTPTKVLKLKVDGESDEEDITGEDDDCSFDPKVAKTLEQIESIQSEIFILNEKASEEILKVEQKYIQLRRPHFEKRNELLKNIQNFWLTSMANHPIIAPMIESEEDEDCLHYMVSLDVEEFEDVKSGYRLKLHFVENPYIKNEVLVKEFQVVSPDEAMVSTSTPIEYKNTEEGMNLKRVVETSLNETRTNRSRRSGPQSQQSFFAWLVEPSQSGQDEIADILKDVIWPNPLELFYAAPEDEYDNCSDDESDEDEEVDPNEIFGGYSDEEEDIEEIEEDDDEDEGDEDEDDDEDDDEVEN